MENPVCDTCRKPIELGTGADPNAWYHVNDGDFEVCPKSGYPKPFVGTDEVEADVTKDPVYCLTRVQEAQTAYWDAISELEAVLDCDLDGVGDYSDHTIESLIEGYAK